MAPGALTRPTTAHSRAPQARPTTAHSRSRQARFQESGAEKLTLTALVRQGGNAVETGYFGSAPRGAGASNVTGHGGPGATAEGRPLSGITRSVPENRLARSASAGGTRVRFGSGDLGNVAKRRPSSSSASFMPIGDPGHILAGRGDPERIADPWRDMVRPQSASSKASSRALSRPGSACYYNALSPMTTCQNVKTEKVQEEIKESEALFRGNRDRKATIKDPFALDREEQKIVDFDEELHVTNTMLEEVGQKSQA